MDYDAAFFKFQAEGFKLEIVFQASSMPQYQLNPDIDHDNLGVFVMCCVDSHW